MSKFYLGIDMGGTNCRIVSYDIEEKFFSAIYKYPFLRVGDVKKEVMANLCDRIQDVCNEKKKQNKSLAGIGIALAALFDRKSGTITRWPNNQVWDGFAIKSFLEDYFHVPVFLEDDANAAAMGEHMVGAGKCYDSFAYVTISTGIGAGIIINDKVFIGHHGFAGELGHIQVTDAEKICTCHAKGCLQAVASGPAILREFKSTNTFQRMTNKNEIDLKQVAELAKQGNSDARQVFCEAGKFIGIALANMAIMFDLPMIILGGGVINTGDIIIEPIKNAMGSSLMYKRSVKLMISELNDKNGIYGAIALIDEYIKGTGTNQN